MVTEASESREKNKRSRGKLIICVVLLGIAVLLALILLKRNARSDYYFYIKDYEIFCADASGKEPVQITSKLIRDKSSYQLEDLEYDLIDFSVALSEDKSKILYVDRIGEDDRGYSLYLGSLKNQKKKSEKIDSEIGTYEADDSFDRILYLKGGSLYLWESGEKEKLAKGVSYYYLSRDWKTLYYITTDSGLFVMKDWEKASKLADNVSSVEFTEDYQTVYYLTHDGSLYKRALDGKEVEIGRNVEDFTAGPETGVYFYEDYYREMTDFLEDDLKIENWEVEFAEKEVSSYSSLYYYDGQQTVKLSDTARLYTTVWGDNPFAVFEEYSGTEKVQLSEVQERYYAERYSGGVAKEVKNGLDISAARELINERLAENATVRVLFDGAEGVLPADNLSSIFVSADKKTIFYLDHYDTEKRQGDLYRVTADDKKLGKPELYDEEVSGFRNFLNGMDGQVSYYKYAGSDTQDIYIDGDCIAYDVSLNSHISWMDQMICYTTDYDEEEECFTLNCYDGEDDEVIADDVSAFGFAENGDVLYLTDYDPDSYEGKLYRYKDGEEERVAKDVMGILPCYSVGAHKKYFW